MSECIRCHYEGVIMCTFILNGTKSALCPECMVDFEKFLRGYTLNDMGIIISRGFRNDQRTQDMYKTE